MKKQYWIIGIVILVLILGYLGRHKLKAMMGGYSTSTPVTQSETSTQSPSTSAAGSQSITMTSTDSSKGSFLTDLKGMTLYTFDKDTSGVSNCNVGCSTTWPPYTVATAPSTLPTNYTVIKRSDGSMQYAYKGMPLYYYAKDAKPGDTLGDGIGNIWHVAKP